MSNNSEDELMIEGVFAHGYGILAKIVIADRRLSHMARLIYAYFASLSGAGMMSFPGVSKICYDLKINKNTYYTHLQYLKAYGYIMVKPRLKNGKFDSNLYILANKPMIQKEILDNLLRDPKKLRKGIINSTKKNSPFPKISETINSDTKEMETTSSETNNKDTIINNHIINNNINNSIDPSSLVKKQCKIDSIDPRYRRLVSDAIDYLYQSQLAANDSEIPNSKLQQLLAKLSYDNILTALAQYKEYSIQKHINNHQKYFATIIFNILVDHRPKREFLKKPPNCGNFDQREYTDDYFNSLYKEG